MTPLMTFPSRPALEWNLNALDILNISGPKCDRVGAKRYVFHLPGDLSAGIYQTQIDRLLLSQGQLACGDIVEIAILFQGVVFVELVAELSRKREKRELGLSRIMIQAIVSCSHVDVDGVPPSDLKSKRIREGGEAFVLAGKSDSFQVDTHT
jgi:hypothetical protein